MTDTDTDRDDGGKEHDLVYNKNDSPLCHSRYQIHTMKGAGEVLRQVATVVALGGVVMQVDVVRGELWLGVGELQRRVMANFPISITGPPSGTKKSQ